MTTSTVITISPLLWWMIGLDFLLGASSVVQYFRDAARRSP